MINKKVYLVLQTFMNVLNTNNLITWRNGHC